MTNPYDHMREAFHIVADGLMEWEDPPERAETAPNATRPMTLTEEIGLLEKAAESLLRNHDTETGIALFAWALRLRAQEVIERGTIEP